MPRFRRITEDITAEQITPGVLMPEGVLVRACTDAPYSYEVYNAKHDTWIKAKAGDWVRTDRAPEDVYPIAADYMADNFERI